VGVEIDDPMLVLGPTKEPIGLSEDGALGSAAAWGKNLEITELLNFSGISFEREVGGHNFVEVNVCVLDNVVPDRGWDIRQIWLRRDLRFNILDVP